MPYGDDSLFDMSERKLRAAERRVAVENDKLLREKLRTKFGVPPEFMDLAVRIWWDGKED